MRAGGELAYHVLDVMTATVEAAAAGGPVELTSTAPPSRPLPQDWDPLAATLAPQRADRVHGV